MQRFLVVAESFDVEELARLLDQRGPSGQPRQLEGQVLDRVSAGLQDHDRPGIAALNRSPLQGGDQPGAGQR